MSNDVQLLNLDELVPVRRRVTVRGVQYNVKDMTVEHFVELNKFVQELDAKKDMTPVESIDATARAVSMSLEGCAYETIRGLTLPQLSVLSQFIRGEFVPGSAERVAPGITGDDAGNV